MGHPYAIQPLAAVHSTLPGISASCKGKFIYAGFFLWPNRKRGMLIRKSADLKIWRHPSRMLLSPALKQPYI
jgi:hypothetical protein